MDEIWPAIRASHKDASLTIVGRNPMKALAERVSSLESVKLTGTVDDVRPYVEQAVVSTKVGAEGLEVRHGENLLIADTPADFAQAVSRLFTDGTLRASMGRSGRQLVEKRYQWRRLSEKLGEIWRDAAAEKARLN